MGREDVALARVESTITEHSLGPWGGGGGQRPRFRDAPRTRMAEAPTGRVFLQVAQGTVLRPQAQGKLDGGGEAGTGIQYRSLAGSRILLPTHCSREVLYGSEAPSGERQSWELNPKSPCSFCAGHTPAIPAVPADLSVALELPPMRDLLHLEQCLHTLGAQSTLLNE